MTEMITDKMQRAKVKNMLAVSANRKSFSQHFYLLGEEPEDIGQISFSIIMQETLNKTFKCLLFAFTCGTSKLLI